MADDINIEIMSPEAAEAAFAGIEAPAETQEPTIPEGSTEVVEGAVEEKIDYQEGDLMSPEDVAALVTSEAEGAEGAEATADPAKTAEANQETNTGNAATLQAFVEDFVEKGLLTPIEGREVKSIEDVEAILEKTISGKAEARFDTWQDSLGEEQKTALGLMDSGISPADAAQLAKTLSQVTAIVPESLEDEKVAESVYRRSLAIRGFSEAEIDEQVEDTIGQGKLEKRAATALPAVQSHYKKLTDDIAAESVVKKEEAKQREIETLERRKGLIDNSSSFLEGYDLTEKQKEALKESFTKVVHTDPKTGTRYNKVTELQRRSPDAFNVALHYLAEVGILNIDEQGNFKPDLSSLKAIKETKITSKLEERLSAERSEVGTQGSQASNISALEALRSLKPKKK